jgi:type III pantothenate kinase
MNRESLVAVAVGNTSLQVGLFTLHDQHRCPQPRWHGSFPVRADVSASVVEAVQRQAGSGLRWFVVSVNRAVEQALRPSVVEGACPAAYRLLEWNDFHIPLEVEHPSQVGADRIAGAVASAMRKPPRRAAIFIDAGTALTVNAVSHEGTFLGGAIAPGLRMSARALAQQTDLLPLVDVAFDQVTLCPELPGRTTEQAICSGIYWGAIGAARELIQRLRENVVRDPVLFVTGGFGQHLAASLDEAEYVPHLVLSGVAIAARQAGSTDR